MFISPKGDHPMEQFLIDMEDSRLLEYYVTVLKTYKYLCGVQISNAVDKEQRHLAELLLTLSTFSTTVINWLILDGSFYAVFTLAFISWFITKYRENYLVSKLSLIFLFNCYLICGGFSTLLDISILANHLTILIEKWIRNFKRHNIVDKLLICDLFLGLTPVLTYCAYYTSSIRLNSLCIAYILYNTCFSRDSGFFVETAFENLIPFITIAYFTSIPINLNCIIFSIPLGFFYYLT